MTVTDADLVKAALRYYAETMPGYAAAAGLSKEDYAAVMVDVRHARTLLARPAAPVALDVERLATVFRGDVMAGWLGIVVGITNPKHPPLAEGFAHDFAAAIAREYAALRSESGEGTGEGDTAQLDWRDSR